jgi:hypothetical protein
MSTDNQYSVCIFLPNDYHEYVRRYVSSDEAMQTFMMYTHNPAAMIGLTNRVIITDGMDCINAEWKFGEGLVFPTKEDMQ